MEKRTQDKHSISRLATVVFDNGRRGEPRQGCDCVRCFGYCLIDGDEQVRDGFRSMAGTVEREDI